MILFYNICTNIISQQEFGFTVGMLKGSLARVRGKK